MGGFPDWQGLHLIPKEAESHEALSMWPNRRARRSAEVGPRAVSSISVIVMPLVSAELLFGRGVVRSARSSGCIVWTATLLGQLAGMSTPMEGVLTLCLAAVRTTVAIMCAPLCQVGGLPQSRVWRGFQLLPCLQAVAGACRRHCANPTVGAYPG